jgi:rfaE bifunctional protein kinase chain/domain
MSEMLSRRRASQLIRRMRGRRIGVLGDWMLDRYVWGSANRISPEAAVPVVDFAKESECPGGAGNVAANLVALGAHVDAFGVVGEDEAGRALRKCLRGSRLSERGILVDPSRQTTLKTRIIARQQQVVRVDRESRTPLLGRVEALLKRRLLPVLPRFDALIVSDYDKGVVTDSLTEQVLGACEKRGIPVFIKPKWSRLPMYRSATAVVCNRAEAGFLVTRTLDTDEAIEEAGRRMLSHFGSAAIVITRGPEGMSLFERAVKKPYHVAAISRERPMGLVSDPFRRPAKAGRQVFDVTGAGDTVLATMALAAASGASLREAVFLGNAAAGVVVSKLGTATLTADELLGIVGEILTG